VGWPRIAQGDLPAALTYLDEAGRRYTALGAANPDLAIDRCRALLAAGLASDALQEADAAADGIRRHGGHAYKRAELLFAAATAALAIGDPVAARERAERARRMFRGQDRSFWEARSTVVLLQARYLTGDHTGRLLAQADQVAARLATYRSDEAPRAHLLAGRIALARERDSDADRHLEHAARSRRRGSPLDRSVGWIAQALRAQARGDGRAMLSACRRGLDALDEHRLTLGATELRAHATTHGAELAAIAQREMLRRADLRRLLLWTERWRATVHALPRVTPPDDPDLVAELSALREATRRLDDNHTTRAARGVLQRERRRLENTVRARVLRTTGTSSRDVPKLDVDQLFAALGDALLVELIEIDGILHVLTAADRKLHLHTVGMTPGREVDRARFLLRRLAYGGAGDTRVHGGPGRPATRRMPSGRGRGRFRGSPGRRGTAGTAARRSLGPSAVVALSPGQRGAVRGYVAAGRADGTARDAATSPSSSGPVWGRAEPKFRCWQSAIRAPPSWATAPRPPNESSRPWTARGSRISPPTGRSARTTRCSPRWDSTTGR
jgi:tetratricopeptide (TPR) repeat protein